MKVSLSGYFLEVVTGIRFAAAFSDLCSLTLSTSLSYSAEIFS